MIVDVVVPIPRLPEKPEAGWVIAGGIKPGSAIVCRQGEPRTHFPDALNNGPGMKPHKQYYFEGNVYGMFSTFAEKLLHAAGRLVENYPTIAKAYLPVDAFIVVGEYNTVSRDFHVFTAPGHTTNRKLDAWMREDARIGARA